MKAVLGLALVVILATGLGYRYRHQILRRFLQVDLDPNSIRGTLSEDEIQVIWALLNVLFPEPAAAYDEFLDFLNIRTAQTDGYYQEYRDAARWLEKEARRTLSRGFAQLSKGQQEELVRAAVARAKTARQQPKPSTLRRRIEVVALLFFSGAEIRLQRFILPDLLQFYWSSSAGWAAVGYDSFPGVPSPSLNYTEAPG